MIRSFRVRPDDVNFKTPYIISFCSNAMFPLHVVLYHFVNLFQKDRSVILRVIVQDEFHWLK